MEIIDLTAMKLKTSINKIKRQRQPYKLFATHINNKGLVIRTCKDLPQIKMKNQQPNGNLGDIDDSIR